MRAKRAKKFETFFIEMDCVKPGQKKKYSCFRKCGWRKKNSPGRPQKVFFLHFFDFSYSFDYSISWRNKKVMCLSFVRFVVFFKKKDLLIEIFFLISFCWRKISLLIVARYFFFLSGHCVITVRFIAHVYYLIFGNEWEAHGKNVTFMFYKSRHLSFLLNFKEKKERKGM